VISLLSFILPPPQDSLTLMSQLITHLFELIEHMYYQLTTLLPFTKHPVSEIELIQLPREIPRSPIFAILTPEPRSLAKHCQASGFMVRPIVPPTVPEGTQRVRVCLHAGNSYQDVERLVASIKDWLEMRGKVEDTQESQQPLLLKASL
jgi:8-amino-7-oxononanoate synthase